MGPTSVCPINEIPPELLARIFWLCMSPFESCEDPASPFWWTGCSRVRKTQELVPLTHVCKLWRDLALQTPLLWSSIDGTGDLSWPASPRLSIVADAVPGIPTDIVLERAAGVLLNILAMMYLHLSVQSSMMYLHPSVQSICQNDSARIQELHLTYIDEEIGTIRRLSDFSAASLEYATFHPTVITVSLNRSPHSRNSNTILLWRGQAPRLRILTWQICICLPSNQFLSLTHLCISAIPGRPPRWRLPDLLKLLSRCPALQELVLARLTAPIPEADPPGVALAALHKFAVERVSPALATWLIDHIIAMDDAAVHIHRPICSPSHIPARMPASRRVDLARIFLSTDEKNRQFNITATGKTSGGIRLDMVEWSPDPDIDVCFICYDWLASLWVTWQLDHVQELWLSECVDLDLLGGYPVILGALPSVTTIFLCESIYPKFRIDGCFNVLTRLLSYPAYDASVFCPQLKTLHLYLVTETIDIKALTDFRRRRQVLGCPIQSVVVEYIVETPWKSGKFSDEDELPRSENGYDFIEYRLRKDPPQKPHSP